MIYLNVLLTVTDEDRVSTVAELLAQQTQLSRLEPGCERFEVYHSRSNPRLFVLIEHWRRQEDLDRHREAKAFREIYQPRVLPLVERDPHPADLIA